jgi:hypothetical protein
LAPEEEIGERAGQAGSVNLVFGVPGEDWTEAREAADGKASPEGQKLQMLLVGGQNLPSFIQGQCR